MPPHKTKRTTILLIRDLTIIAVSILFAIALLSSGVLSAVLASTKQVAIIGSFIAGMFFTSIFTTAPAIATLGEIALTNSLAVTAIFGGLGAVIGDLIIFRFVRDSLSIHFMDLLAQQGIVRRCKSLMRLHYFRWLPLLIGGLIIASPLPDELGVSMLGFSKLKVLQFAALSFFFNFLGIFIVGLVAQSL